MAITLKLDQQVFKSVLSGVNVFSVANPFYYYEPGDHLDLRELNKFGQILTGRALTVILISVKWAGADAVLTVKQTPTATNED